MRKVVLSIGILFLSLNITFGDTIRIIQHNFPISDPASTTDFGSYAEREIPNGGVAYITGEPSQPDIAIVIADSPPNAAFLCSRFVLTSERPERNGIDDLLTPGPTENNYSEQSWSPHNSNFAKWFVLRPFLSLNREAYFGGTLTCYYHYKDADGKILSEDSIVSHKIRGKNPVDANVKAYLGQAGGGHWYLWPIVQHESRLGDRVYNQFNSSGSWSELPNFSGSGKDDGWGIAQLDRPLDQRASTEEVYNWKSNIDKFYQELWDAKQGKEAVMKRYFKAIKRLHPKKYEDPPNQFVHPGTSTSMTAMDAGVITLYNGPQGCPKITIDGLTYQNPWSFDPKAPKGSKWKYNPNAYNYLYEVIYNEFEGHLPYRE